MMRKLSFMFTFILFFGLLSAYGFSVEPPEVCSWGGDVFINGNPVNGTLVVPYDASDYSPITNYSNPAYGSNPPFGKYTIDIFDFSGYVIFKINGIIADQLPSEFINGYMYEEFTLTATDADNDGYGVGYEGYNGTDKDCDDTNPNINPGADEVCDNGIDDDCDGQIDLDDSDCQGCPWSAKPEECNGKDDDCDNQIDEPCEWNNETCLDYGYTKYYYDNDEDGYGVDDNYMYRCSPYGDYSATQGGDCDDENENANPGIEEPSCDADNIDNDCDGSDAPSCGGGGGGVARICGNGRCEYGENYCSCPEDCTPSVSCGECQEVTCENGEEVCNPITPCCGNGVCEEGESCDTCPEDCGECPATAGEATTTTTIETTTTTISPTPAAPTTPTGFFATPTGRFLTSPTGIGSIIILIAGAFGLWLFGKRKKSEKKVRYRYKPKKRR